MITIPRTFQGRRVPLLTALAGLACGLCVAGGLIALYPTSVRAGGAAFPATSIVPGPANTLWFVQFQPNLSWFYSIGRISTQGTVTMFPISGEPIDIAPRPDGTLLIAMQGGVIWTITAQGDLRPFYAIPGGAATNIIAAPDGTVWFSAGGGSAGPFIGHLTATGKLIAHYRVPGLTGGLAFDGMGNLWATETFGKAIDRVSPRGTLSRFPLPAPGAYPLAIQPGPDGTMWFTEDGAIGHITASGRITPYVLPVTQDLSRGSGPQYDPYDLTAGGPDGGLWFTDQRADALGHITVHGQVSFHALPGTNTDNPLALTVGADGRLWFTTGTAQIGAMAPDGQVTMYKLPVSAPPASVPILRQRSALVHNRMPGPSLDTVSFVDARHGWAGGTALLATSDGGQTWHRQSSPAATVYALDFVDSRHGWALGQTAGATPILVRTTNGGAHWSTAREPVSALQSVDFLSPTFGVGVAGGQTYVQNCEACVQGAVVVTDDGGQSWRVLPTPASVGAVCFADQRHGWAAVAGKGILLHTTDGGQSWQQSLPDGPIGAAFYMGAELACEGPGSVWALLSAEGGMSQELYALYHTSDGGTHWTVVAAKMGIGGNEPLGTPGIPPKANRFSWAGKAIGSIGGSDYAGPLAAVHGTVLHLGGATPALNTVSVDGTTIAGLVNPFPALSFVSAKQGWLATDLLDERDATQPGVILATTDGARTWQEQYPSSSPHPLIALSFPTPTLGYGLGRLGDAQSILRTTDGGRRWEQVGTLPVTYAYPRTGSLSFVNARLGWAILGGDALDTTTDGGRTWRRIPVARLNPVHVLQGVAAVAFADARDGCLATQDLPPAYWGTDDGGAQWHPVPVAASISACAALVAGHPAGSALAAMPVNGTPSFDIISGVIGLQAAWGLREGCSVDRTGRSHGPQLLQTGDGGQTWTQVDWPGCASVQAAAFATVQDGWLLTTDGRLYQTTNAGVSWTQLP